MKRFKMKKLILFIIAIPLLAYSDGQYTGERILKAAQKYGMTDSELNYLIDNTGPDLTLKDPQTGATALIYACVNNRPNMVKILIERGGSDIDEVDNNGETCLIGAARKGHIEVVNLLLQSNARRDIVGNLNKSAFDYAVEFGHTEIARLLGGPPKQKVSFKTIAKLAVNKKPGGNAGAATSLSAQKYIQDLGKISLIVENMKPVPGAPGKVEVNKLNEIAKITGFSDVVKRQMTVRDQMEEKLRLEKEAQKAKAKSVMMAKLKAISAFNNLYLDVSSKKEGSPGVQGGAGKQNADINKLSFSDATNQLMSEMELKLKKKEEEINREKELDIERGAAERNKAIMAILFAGTKGNKDIAALKAESPEKLKEKFESIRALLDVKESPKVRSISLQTARKKIMVINGFQTSGKEFLDRAKALDLEEQELKKKAALEAKMEEDRRLAELARNEELERQNFYRVVQERARASKFTENLKQKSGVGQQGGGTVSVEEEKTKASPEFGAKKEFDEVRGAITTPDFMVWILTNRDCQIRRNSNGTFYVIISKLKLSKVVQASRKDAIWFINTSGKVTPLDGGLECKHFCKDPAIYVGNLYNNPRREVFLSNLIIQLGKAVNVPFEIYSSVPGNKPIQVPINECKMAF